MEKSAQRHSALLLINRGKKKVNDTMDFQFYCVFFFLFLYLFSSFDGMARIHKPNNYILLNNTIFNTIYIKKKNTDIIFFAAVN